MAGLGPCLRRVLEGLSINDELGLCELGRVASNKLDLYTIYDDYGLRVVPCNLKGGLHTVISKFSGSGPKFGPSLASRFGLQVASFEFGLSMAFSFNKFGPGSLDD